MESLVVLLFYQEQDILALLPRRFGYHDFEGFDIEKVDGRGPNLSL
jgi:hypothetical protein